MSRRSAERNFGATQKRDAVAALAAESFRVVSGDNVQGGAGCQLK